MAETGRGSELEGETVGASRGVAWGWRRWELKAFAIFATTLMVLVVFSQNVGPAISAAAGSGGDAFEEQSRRLTVAGGLSNVPKVALGAGSSIQVTWIDGRSGSLGVYHKVSRDGGFTFSGDRALSTGFISISDLTLATNPLNRTVAVAWSGSSGTGTPRVYVRASADDGVMWGPIAVVGPGDSASLAAAPGRLLLAYVYRDLSGPSQVRLVSVSLAGNALRGGRGLLAFNGTASDAAVVLAGGFAHVAWVERIAGVTVIAHVSVNPATGVSSAAHVIGTFRASLSGRLSLVGRGSTLALFWSDDAGGTFDVKDSVSLDSGATWPGVSPLVAGPRNETAPAAAFGSDYIGVAWQQDDVVGSQIFGRLLDTTGRALAPAKRVSASPTWASDAALSFGAGSRDLVVAWSDSRDAPSEIYADLDVLLEKARIPTMAMYAKRLDAADFVPPGRDSKAALLDLIAQTRDRAERREEARAADFLRTRVMNRFDGSLGGDPSDDLVVNATAQADLTRIARAILTSLEGGGTRAGEPGGPPPGEGGDPSPEPTPSSGGTAGAKPVIQDVTISNVLATQATVSWTVFSPDVTITGSFVDWGLVSTSEHRTWDNTTPYSVTLAPLQSGKTYRLVAGAKYGTGGAFTSYSNYFTVYTGVALDSIRTTNVSSTLGTVEWRTNVPATTSLSYGKNESNLATTLTGSSGTLHQVNLTGLGMRETYFYRVKSVATLDASLSNVSGMFSFETVMRITNLTHVESLVAGSFNITFSWDTNFVGTTQVRYGENTTLFGRASDVSGTHHSVKVSGLKSKTTCYWQVYSEATNGSGTYVAAAGFSLTPNGSATPYAPSTEPKSESVLGSAPITSWAVSIVNVTFDRQAGSITAKWNTTYRANAILKYKSGTGSWTTISTYASESTFIHSVQVTGLASWTTYTFLLNSTSSSNAADTASSGNRNATTKNIAITQTPTATPSVTSAVISWSTSPVTGTTVVRYGIASIWELTGTAADGQGHTITVAGLLPDTPYKYRVESAASANKNDVAVDVERTFRTLVAENDANTSSDAGGAFANATHVEPGVWTGWVNPSHSYYEDKDFFKFQAFANQQIKVKMTLGTGYDLNVLLWKPSGAWVASSNTTGTESITYDVGSSAGFWRIEVVRVSGSGRLDYTLAFNATGGGVEKFVVDVGYPVGSPADLDHIAQTPGINIGTNWTAPQTSSMTSTALDKYIGGTIKPDYRSVSPANGTFYLNLHRTSWERYTDYLFTLQYYSSADTNVSVWNGAGWMTLALVPGQSNWRAFSFLLEHTMFYDAEPAWAGLNVKLRFEKPIQVDLIAAVPWKHTTYVGSGSDDSLDPYHVPGVRLLDGWVSAGQGYKNATASGGVVVVTVPDTTAGYLVRMRFDGNSSGITMQRWTGSAWAFAASVSNFNSGEALFVMDPTWYVDAFSTWPGMNVKVRLVPNPRLNQVTLFSLEPVHWTTDVGVAGDNVTTNHVPGMSVGSNSEWGAPATVDGRSVRVGQRYADLYLNLPWPTGSMIGYVTYKAGSSGTVELDTGTQWTTVGVIVGDNAWHTAVLFAQGLKVGNGPGQDSSVRTFHDAFGDAFVNADLQFNVLGGVTLDAMWVDVDSDGDNLTSFGEPNPYATEDTTLYILQQGGQQGLYVDKNWEVLTEGRWQFDLSLTLYGSINPLHFSGVTASVDGVEIGSVHRAKVGTETDSFPAMLCTGPRKLRIASNGDVRVDVTRIAFRKLPTDPDRNDTDGDGLRDGREACAKRTDPTQADTDGDGLTDYEEVYTFNYNNATSTPANVTTNVTVGAVGEYRWTIKTDATLGGGTKVKAIAYLDGQLKWSKESSAAWTNDQATFDAILPRGLHSLQVQKATAKGTVTLRLVNVTKPLALSTNALFWDTDHDGLSDGDELLGKTGWMTSPNKTDTDGDGASDGNEVRVLHTDPLLKDTDQDGVVDGKDRDPLHDLVVQVRVSYLRITDYICNPCNYQYNAHVGIDPNWTRTQSVDRNTDLFPNHILSVNVPDDRDTAMLRLSAWTTEASPAQIDVSPGPGKEYTLSVDLRKPDQYGLTAYGNEARYAFIEFDVKVLRVGKANTLLLTPSDWSTLSNGTVDGTPTGLHRFVGENRFVVGLLNVTDGNGDISAYDFEAKDSGGLYSDLAGNLSSLSGQGYSDAPGYFGGGARLGGSSSRLAPITVNPLNWINGSFTVAFWVRPETDYVNGTNWRWSFGRQSLWRLGFYGPAQGVRLDVWDTGGGLHNVQAAYPVYSGRWYHLAATMSSAGGWTRLTIYVNGLPVAWRNDTPAYNAMDSSTTYLYMGYDQATLSSFKGIVDEFRLYKIALSQDSIRGLMWFLKGANNVIVPRGVFYDSKLYGGLNGSFSASSPFAGATAYGNSNSLSSNLNSRVIQMVLTKNLTLAQAWGILDLARTNTSGVVTAFPFFATSEFYTLGFSWEVSKLAANTSVANGGNWSAPPPPPAWWQLYWNAIAGWAERAWNAALAVGAFFASVGKWLAQAFMSYVKGLTTGNWTDFQNNVLEPIRKALNAFLNALEEMIKNTMSVLVAPLRSGLREIIAPLAGYLTYITSRHFDPSPLDIAAIVLEGIVFVAGAFMLVLASLAAILMFVENVPPILLLKPTLILIRNLVVYALTPIILVAVVGLSIPVPADASPRNPGVHGGTEILRERVPSEVQFLAELPYSLSDLMLEMMVVSAPPEKELPFVETGAALLDAGVALAIDAASAYIENPREALFWDLFSLIFGLIAWGEAALDPAGEEVPLTSTIVTSLATVAIALSINSISQDVAAISRGG